MPDRNGAAKLHVRVGEGSDNVSACPPIHRNTWDAPSSRGLRRTRQGSAQNERVMNERVGAIAATAAPMLRDAMGDETAATPRRRSPHADISITKGKAKATRPRARPLLTCRKTRVESDHAGNREQIRTFGRKSHQSLDRTGLRVAVWFAPAMARWGQASSRVAAENDDEDMQYRWGGHQICSSPWLDASTCRRNVSRDRVGLRSDPDWRFVCEAGYVSLRRNKPQRMFFLP